MNAAEVITKLDEILYSQAYDRAHSDGREETAGLFVSLKNDFAPIYAYLKTQDPVRVQTLFTKREQLSEAVVEACDNFKTYDDTGKHVIFMDALSNRISMATADLEAFDRSADGIELNSHVYPRREK